MKQFPNVAVWSLFRDNAGDYITEYRKRVEALDYPPECLRFYLGEGDSTDGTWEDLGRWYHQDNRLVLIKRDTGLPYLQATPRPERMKCLALTGNAVYRRMVADDWADYALMLESDLLYTDTLIHSLLDGFPDDAVGVAPMVWIKVGPEFRFYDVWAFRNGKKFPPYTPAWYFNKYGTKPIEVDSAGSCILFKMDALRAGVKLSSETAIVGMCEQMREHGKLYALSDVHIIHPEPEIE